MTPELEAELKREIADIVSAVTDNVPVRSVTYSLTQANDAVAVRLSRIRSLVAEEAARICEDNQVETVLGGGARRLAKFDKETEARHEGQVYAAEIRRQLKGEG